MTVLVNNQTVAISPAMAPLGPFVLTPGTRRIRATYSMSAWPADSDGVWNITLKISDDGGTDYRDEWSASIRHEQLLRGGVAVTSASFEIQLQNPFLATSRLLVAIDPTVAGSTQVTIEAV